MLCTNCYRKINDDAKICPHCNAPIDKTVIRCPECWTKLPANTEICTKCGSNIEKSLKEKEEIKSYKKPTLADKVRKMPAKTKVIIISVLVVIIAVIAVLGTAASMSRRENLKVLTAEYTLFTDDAIAKISKIAEHYENDVYTKDWITYIESAQELREKYKDDIEEIRKSRESVSHRRNKIKALGDNKAGRLADRIYYCYSSCYGYVIGETGKYPNYLKNYNKLVDEYKKAAEELKEYAY